MPPPPSLNHDNPDISMDSVDSTPHSWAYLEDARVLDRSLLRLVVGDVREEQLSHLSSTADVHAACPRHVALSPALESLLCLSLLPLSSLLGRRQMFPKHTKPSS